jgi:hypothetical protein
LDGFSILLSRKRGREGGREGGSHEGREGKGSRAYLEHGERLRRLTPVWALPRDDLIDL